MEFIYRIPWKSGLFDSGWAAEKVTGHFDVVWEGWSLATLMWRVKEGHWSL